MHPARHLKQRIKVIHWRQAAEKSGQAKPSVATHHSKRIKQRPVSDQFQHAVDSMEMKFTHVV
jgi:hypothetical protein